jgi:glycosyltransferase involved in cell wall biosynthesis
MTSEGTDAMRIAHFVHRYPPALGGSEAYFARLSRTLAARGAAVRVYTTNALDLEAFWSRRGRRLPAGVAHEQGVEVRRYALWHWPAQRYALKLLSLVPARALQCLTVSCTPIVPGMWADCGRERDVDLVHATALPYGWPLMCGLRLARRCRVPFLLTPFLHLGDPRNPRDRTRRGYLSPAMTYLLRAADRLFVQTEVEWSALRRLGIPAGRLVLQGLGVDPAECTGGDREQARRRWGIGTDEVVIGHLANKSVEKGTVDLLRAADSLARAGLRFRVLLAGPEMPNFLRYWQSAALAVPVTRLGVLSEAEKRDFYAAVDGFALPSRSDSFGLVFLEAWTNGVPCIGYRAGGVADVIHHGRDGLLVDCGDLAGLADALRRLVTDRSLRHDLGRAGQERALREHQWPARLAIVCSAYHDVAGLPSAQSA